MRVIGMISGTSFDAVEAVAADLSLEGNALVCDLLGHESAPYPPALQQAVAELLPPAATTIAAVCQLDTALGQHFAKVAQEVVTRHCDGHADLITSHGQTVFHWVEGGEALGTLQIGEPAWIAERTGATVVSDVRSRDIASGGQGAPFASLLDVLLLGGSRDRVRAALNLGGIANVTILDPMRDPIAFDTGPANALIDAAVTWITQGVERFDRDGARAAAGSVDDDLLTGLLADPYYTAPPPKSTGKERFHLAYLRDAIGSQLIAPDDLIATLTALTAETVARTLRQHAVTEIVASGGGTRNPTLMAALRERLPGVEIRAIDDYGIPEAAKEALAFAIIGFLTVHGLPGVIASCTGARHTSILGSITPGSATLRPAEGLPAPTRLVLRTPLVSASGAGR